MFKLMAHIIAVESHCSFKPVARQLTPARHLLVGGDFCIHPTRHSFCTSWWVSLSWRSSVARILYHLTILSARHTVGIASICIFYVPGSFQNPAINAFGIFSYHGPILQCKTVSDFRSIVCSYRLSNSNYQSNQFTVKNICCNAHHFGFVLHHFLLALPLWKAFSSWPRFTIYLVRTPLRVNCCCYCLVNASKISTRLHWPSFNCLSKRCQTPSSRELTASSLS